MIAVTDTVIKRPAREVKAVAAITAPALVLTKDEAIILNAFRKMDNQSRRQFLITMTKAAARSQPFRTTPALRLIVGGAA